MASVDVRASMDGLDPAKINVVPHKEQLFFELSGLDVFIILGRRNQDLEENLAGLQRLATCTEVAIGILRQRAAQAAASPANQSGPYAYIDADQHMAGE